VTERFEGRSDDDDELDPLLSSLYGEDPQQATSILNHVELMKKDVSERVGDKRERSDGKEDAAKRTFFGQTCSSSRSI
jgi:hypothetical protein